MGRPKEFKKYFGEKKRSKRPTPGTAISKRTDDCGCHLITYPKEEFPVKYVPTVFGTFVADIELDAKSLEFPLRTLTYKKKMMSTITQFKIFFHSNHPHHFDQVWESIKAV